MKLFERLKLLREARHLLKKDIAASCGISLRAYQYYESGEREPAVSILVSLADYFDVSIDYLVGRTNNPDSHKV